MTGFEKCCLQPGCRAHACFGRGSLRRNTVVFVCPAHHSLIGRADSSVPGHGSAGAAPAQRNADPRAAIYPAPPPPQGQLI